MTLNNANSKEEKLSRDINVLKEKLRSNEKGQKVNTFLKINENDVIKIGKCWNCNQDTNWKMCKNGNYYSKCFSCGSRAFCCTEDLKECPHNGHKKQGTDKHNNRYKICRICGCKLFVPIELEVTKKYEILEEKEASLKETILKIKELYKRIKNWETRQKTVAFQRGASIVAFPVDKDLEKIIEVL